MVFFIDDAPARSSLPQDDLCGIKHDQFLTDL